jgi:UDP-N-acetylmuramyl pentapeptide phosphotransferase/UDP-N-acetylglucosamine-1-phosphate transferase
MQDLLPAALAFLAAVPAVWGATLLAPRLGLLDVPGPRSSHARPVARAGGIGVGAVVFLGATLAAVAFPEAGRATDLLAWTVPAAGFFAIGLLDDLRDLRAGTKALLQSGAALLAVLLGLRWEGTPGAGFPALSFGDATPVLTWLWIVAAVNLANLLDGIDLITCATSGVVLALAAGAGAGPPPLFALSAGAVLGLAVWNATPARVFPGDAGTHLLGFLVGAAALGGPGGAALPWPVAAAPLLPGALDVAGGIAAKVRRGIPWWAPHRLHLYQRLTGRGWPHALIAVRFGALALAAAAVAGLVVPRAGWLPALLVTAALLGGHLVHGARDRAPPPEAP